MINFDTVDNRNGVFFAACLLVQGAMIFKIQAVYTRALKAIKSSKKNLVLSGGKMLCCTTPRTTICVMPM